MAAVASSSSVAPALLRSSGQRANRPVLTVPTASRRQQPRAARARMPAAAELEASTSQAAAQRAAPEDRQARQGEQQLHLDGAPPLNLLDSDQGGGSSGGDAGGRDSSGNGNGGGWGAGGSGGEASGGGGGESGLLDALLRGLKGRLAADPEFGFKLLVECGLDAMIIIGVNLAARRERFLPEIDFTLCQLAISLLSDFALVYLLAPTPAAAAAAAAHPAARRGLAAALAALPAHAFQRSLPGAAPFTPAQRLGTLGLKAAQYGSVGFSMGVVGAGSVCVLIGLRERVDPGFVPPSTVQSVSGTGLAWGGFMGTNSNLRYNLVNGCEELLYARSSAAGRLGSVALRLANNWAGAAQWVWLTRRLQLDVPYQRRQAAAEPARKA